MQSRALAYWPDGSIKWSGHVADSDCMSETVCLEPISKENDTKASDSMKFEETRDSITVHETQKGWDVDTGRMTLTILKASQKDLTADLAESEEDFQDELVKQFQENICNIKTDRTMGERYMIFEEMLREEKQEGRLETKREDILELLEDLGTIPDELRDRIAGIENLEVLKVLHKIAARADSFHTFEEKMEEHLHSKEKQE